MSRTYRRPLVSSSNEASYIKHNYSARISTRTVRKRKPEQQYASELAAAKQRYDEQLKSAQYDKDGKPYVGFRSQYNWYTKSWNVVPSYIYFYKPSRFEYVTIDWETDQQLQYVKQRYAESFRDGKRNQSGRKRDFKQAAAKCVRRANKRFNRAVLIDSDYDNIPYPNGHEGDYLRWCFW